MKMNTQNLLIVFLTATAFTCGIWLWEIFHSFRIAVPWWEIMPYLISNGIDDPRLRPITIKSILMGYGGLALFLYLVLDNDQPNIFKRVIGGARIVDANALTSITREKPFIYWLAGIKEAMGIEKRKREQIDVASIPIPKKVESLGTLIVGSTGTGKTTAQDEMLSAVMERGDRVIVVDPNGHAMARFKQKGDIVLNPLDKRFPGWNPFNEIRSNYDYEQISKALVTDTQSPEAQEWRGNAQLLLTEILKRLAVEEEVSSERMVYWGTRAPFQELEKMLAGTAAEGMFESGAERARGSTRFVLNSQLKSFVDIPDGNFSLRTWLESGEGNLYIPWRSDMHARVRPIISCFVEILMNNILSISEINPRPLWMFLDELASLQYLTSLEDALTKGRKHGLRVVAALQAVSQLEAIYGQAHATSIRSCFRNLIVLGGTSADPATAKEMSIGFGECEVERTHITKTKTSSGTTIAESIQHSREMALMPSEIAHLPDMKGFIQFSGDFPIGRIRLKSMELHARVKPFMER